MRMMVPAAMSALFVFAVAPVALAQLTAASHGPIVYGHHHLSVTSIDEHKKFWVDTLGGELVTLGNLEIVRFPSCRSRSCRWWPQHSHCPHCPSLQLSSPTPSHHSLMARHS